MRIKRLVYLKDLLFALTVKELKSKYKSTALGFLWIIVNPLIQMAVLTVVFSYFLKINVINYPLFVFSGLLPWTFFSLGLQTATSSLIGNRDLIKKVPFPTVMLPISSVTAHFVGFLFALILLVIFAVFTTGVGLQLLILIPVAILHLTFAISLALIFSSLDIYYRDVTYIVQALILVWFYITPIIYPLSIVPSRYLLFYKLNPLVGITTTYQSALLKNMNFSLYDFGISVGWTLGLLVMAIFIFRSRSKFFADWV